MKIYILDSFHTEAIKHFITTHMPSYEVVDNIESADVCMLSAKMILYREVHVPYNKKIIAMSTLEELLSKLADRSYALLDKNSLVKYAHGNLSDSLIKAIKKDLIEILSTI